MSADELIIQFYTYFYNGRPQFYIHLYNSYTLGFNTNTVPIFFCLQHYLSYTCEALSVEFGWKTHPAHAPW